MATGLLVALRGDLEQAVVSAVDTTDDLVAVRRCADTAEVLAAGLAGLGAVAVIDAELGVDRSLVARLVTSGTLTVVVCAASETARYVGLGAHAVVRGDGAPEVLVAVRRALADGVPVVPEAGAPVQEVPAPGRERGGLVVITGPHGAPGRTTLAVNVAGEIAAAGHPVLLIDADVWGAALAPALGMLEESAGLVAAVRAADQGTLDASSLGRLCLPVGERIRLLPGLPRAARWREVSSVGVDTVWHVARDLARWVVVDAAAWVPDDDDAGFDAVLGARRNAVLTSALAAADEVVVVGAAEPLGVQRLVQLLLDMDEREQAPGRHVVLTRVRAAAAGPRPADSVVEALSRFAGVSDPVLVPDDRAACDRAQLAGGTLAEVAPRSVAREAMRALAMRLVGEPAGPRRRRGLAGLLGATRRTAERPAHPGAPWPQGSDPADPSRQGPMGAATSVPDRSRAGGRPLPAGYGPPRSGGTDADGGAGPVARRSRREPGGGAEPSP